MHGSVLMSTSSRTLTAACRLLPLLSALALAACDGPNAKAGKERDKAAAAAAGIPYTGDGPGERIGKAQDRAAAVAKDARDAQADALRQQAKDVRAKADIDAERLEEQAKAIRARANADAAPLEARAKAVRQQ